MICKLCHQEMYDGICDMVCMKTQRDTYKDAFEKMLLLSDEIIVAMRDTLPPSMIRHWREHMATLRKEYGILES